MGLTWFDGGRAFLARFGALLAEEEAAEHLVIARALHAPERGRFAVVTEAGAPLLFAAVDGRGYWVVGKLRGRGEALAEAAALPNPGQGFLGPRATLAGLASYRADLCFREAHLLRELTEIRAVVGPGGTLRAVAPAERDHACEWMAAFFAEALPEEVVPLETLTDSLVASGDLFWLVAGGEIVSMAGAIRPTFTGASIAYVYTPIEQRGRGYGTAVTDRLCRRLLAGGRQRLWLFTVPENPISNHIYAKLGFEHVDDFALFSVVASPDGSGGLAR